MSTYFLELAWFVAPFVIPLVLVLLVLVQQRQPAGRPPFSGAVALGLLESAAAVVLVLLAGMLLVFGMLLSMGDSSIEGEYERFYILTLNPINWALAGGLLVAMWLALRRNIGSVGLWLVVLAGSQLGYWFGGIGVPDVLPAQWWWFPVGALAGAVLGALPAWAAGPDAEARRVTDRRIGLWALAGAGTMLGGLVLGSATGRWSAVTIYDRWYVFDGDPAFAATIAAFALGLAVVLGGSLAWLFGLLRGQRRLVMAFGVATLLGLSLMGAPILARPAPVPVLTAEPAQTTPGGATPAATPASPTTGRMLTTGAAWEPVQTIALSPQATWLIAVKNDGAECDGLLTLIGWRASDWTVAYSTPITNDLTTPGYPTLAFAPDGQTVALGLGGGALALYRASSGELVRTLPVPVHHGADVCWHSLSPTFSPDGTLLAAAESDGTDIWIWRVADGTLLRTLPVAPLYAGQLVFTPDGQTLAAGLADGRVRLIRWDDGVVLRTLEVPAPTADEPVKDAAPWAISRDGTLLLAETDPYGAVIWRLTDGGVALAVQHGGSPGFFTPDAQRVISASHIWRTTDGKTLTYLDCGDSPANIRAFAATPDGQWGATSIPGQICVWRLP